MNNYTNNTNMLITYLLSPIKPAPANVPSPLPVGGLYWIGGGGGGGIGAGGSCVITGAGFGIGSGAGTGSGAGGGTGFGETS